ncbi:MAG: sigma-70 family RNA polymerase sigma factor [Bacillus sp. (in: firmicutes)]
MKDNIDAIYNSYFQDVYYFLLSLCHNHHTAEDLVQETFFRAHLFLESYRGENVKTWLFTVAYNAFIDHYRKHKKTVIQEQDFFTGYVDKKKSVVEEILVREEVEEIIASLKDLPEKHKIAVLLSDFHGLTTSEAAKVMNVKQSYFKVLLFRGRQAIRQRRESQHE